MADDRELLQLVSGDLQYGLVYCQHGDHETQRSLCSKRISVHIYIAQCVFSKKFINVYILSRLLILCIYKVDMSEPKIKLNYIKHGLADNNVITKLMQSITQQN